MPGQAARAAYPSPTMPPLFRRTPFAAPAAPCGAAKACDLADIGLPDPAWERFGVWLLTGMAPYAARGHRPSTPRGA